MKDALSIPFSAMHRRIKPLFADPPVDLLGIAWFVIVATVVLSVLNVSSPIVRAIFGFPLLFFVPGYIAVSVLFPRDSPVSEKQAGRALIAQTRELSDVERAALSFGLSVAIVPLLGLVIAAGPWGYTDSTVIGVVSGSVLGGTILAISRRQSLPPADRYHVRLGERLTAARAAILDAESAAHTAINVALVVSMLLALTTVGYALVAPQQGEEYTSLQLLTENDSGDLVASGYPDAIEPGESIPLVIALENHEQQAQNYTIVVQEQRMEDGDVVERTELQSINYALSDGETGHGYRDITPVAEEGTVRVSVQVYLDDPPAEPTHEDAYRHAYFWVDVTDDPDADGDDGEDGTD